MKSGKDKPAAGRWTFVVVSTCLVLGASGLFGRLVVFHFPWRFTEVMVLIATVAVAAGVGSWWVAGKSRLRLRWMVLLGLGWVVVGSAYALSYRANLRENIRPMLDYIDRSRVAGPVDSASPTTLNHIVDHFASRHPVPLEELPRLHLGWLETSQLEGEARELMASRYEFMSLPAVTLSEDLDWDENPYGSHPWAWRLHNMAYVVNLARAYEATDHLPYLERAEELILDWIDDNSGYVLEPPTEYVWNDHGTAIRLTSWLYFWEVWTKSPRLDAERMRRILGSMLAHAERLADADFYWRNHNHGIDQDRALLAFALVFPELRTAEKWRNLALERLAVQLETTISPRGVHLEHSPGYHADIMDRLQELERLFRYFDVADRFEHDLEALQSDMARFLATTVQPNGRIAPLGDTGKVDLEETTAWHHPAARSWLEYFVTGGESGTLHDTVFAYPDEGYAVIRDFGDGSVPFDQSFYLLFTTAANRELGRRAHKHADDLSFILSYQGHEFLIDSGLYGYERDRNRDYVVSSRAHNTVLIDGESFTGWDSELEEFETTSDYAVIRASHRNYPGFEHTRWIVFIRPNKLILVDDVQPIGPGRDDHVFDQLFHFGPDVEVVPEVHQPGITARPGSDLEAGCPTLRILQLAGTMGVEIARGQHEPMLGWHSTEVGAFEPSFSVSFSTVGREALYTTLLDLSDCNREASPMNFQLRTETQNDGSLSITWQNEEAGGRVDIDRTTGDFGVVPDTSKN